MIGVPLTDLRPLQASPDRDDFVAELARQQQWVAEGSDLRGLDGLLERATDIVWLDVPLRVALWRTVGRRGLDGGTAREVVRFHLRRQAMDPDGSATRAAIRRELARRRSKVVRCANRRQIERFLDTVPKVV
jgi:hypothetical protein